MRVVLRHAVERLPSGMVPPFLFKKISQDRNQPTRFELFP